MKELNVGIVAHVDAGKTTLSEALLFVSGQIRKQGRVDKRDSFLDHHELERQRGITIFSKQAVINTGDLRITLLDTPGHVDFSAETERTLSVIDYALLVISGSEGVQAHTETIFGLLKRYKVPTFVFVTKMDLAVMTRSEILSGLTSRLGEGFVDFTQEGEDLSERIAIASEELLEKYASGEEISDADIAKAVGQRKLFPCFFGSGLKLDGIGELIAALGKYTSEKRYSDVFSAKVYKIGRDESGTRLTYMKITGGCLSVRSQLSYTTPEGDEINEKITSIRLYSGAKYTTVDSVEAGRICAVAGLGATFAGQVLGHGGETREPVLEPILSYRLILPPDCDPVTLLPKLRELEEEEPMLRIAWNERFREIRIHLMGQVQSEIITDLIASRFGTSVTLGEGHILYKETVTAKAEGVGHFEPLRHYAEVHLTIEPLPPGSGIVCCTEADEDDLERSWQRLILSHLEEKRHRGVLTGAPLTDVKLTVVLGRAHLKHTQSGDFREASCRAVRMGLMKLLIDGKCQLLEPYYLYRLELPPENVGRAMTDIISKNGTCTQEDSDGETAILTGSVPAATFSDYGKEVAAYSHGRGKLVCRPGGYHPCHNESEIIARADYDPVADVANTPDSVFCSHGAGFIVPWNEVPGYMHLPSCEEKPPQEDPEMSDVPQVPKKESRTSDKELDALMDREFGPIRRKSYSEAVKITAEEKKKDAKPKAPLYIVDGYNLIFAWDELADAAKNDLDYARKKLVEVLADYHAFTKNGIILVFDAYNVKGAVEREFEQDGIKIVFTKEGELGDTYIERLIDGIGKDYSVRAVTSDAMIQLQALRSGVLRMSAREFRDGLIAADAEIEKILRDLRISNQNASKGNVRKPAPGDPGMKESPEKGETGKKRP